ncbi:hypothetical protein QCA50_019125 [Cerrena zonata]|uniref:Protection of telomeres protein 1 n=1 Tax=Cerrena zonata TaxID=2478898 RepID=A0AAW0FBE3_9APHY
MQQDQETNRRLVIRQRREEALKQLSATGGFPDSSASSGKQYPAPSPGPGANPVRIQHGSVGLPVLNIDNLLYFPLVTTLPANNTSACFNFIGIVLSISEIETSQNTGDLSRKLVVVDESTWKGTGYNKRSVTIQCFTNNKHENILGEAQPGDVIILRGIRVRLHNNALQYLGASLEYWSWEIVDGDRIKFSRSSKRAEHQLSIAEIEYCNNLKTWWQNIDQDDISTASNMKHKLIQELKQYTSGNGHYFDCTIEVIHIVIGHGNGPSCLYVTDYTHNTMARPETASWCPITLKDKILQIAMWDSAKGEATQMETGCFYSLKNVKIMACEGKMNEDKKIKKLDVDELERHPHLVSLLRRRKEAKSAAADSKYLLQDAGLDNPFQCTAEVLSISEKADKFYLYITDYTARSDLCTVFVSTALVIPDDMVIRVTMRDRMAISASSITSGDFVTLHNLCLTQLSNGKVHGVMEKGASIARLGPEMADYIELDQRKKGLRLIRRRGGGSKN